MLLMHAFPCPLSDLLLSSVSLMLFILQLITLVAHFLSSSRNDLEALQLQPMLLEAAAQQVLFQVVCKSFHMFHNQQVETMATPTAVAALIIAITRHRKLMVNHMLRKAKSLINNLQYRCIMVARLRLEDMEVSDPNNRSNLISVALNPTPVHQLSQCKAWFLASH